jgi:small conductance mechanosensitive channel
MPEELNDTFTTAFETLQSLVTEYALSIIGAIVLLILGLWLSRIIRRNIRKGMESANLEPSLVSFLTNLSYYLMMGLVVVAALIVVGVPQASLVAALGTVGLAIGLALQGSLANFAAGVVILLTRPFKVGDMVEIDGKFGFVEEIQIIQTILRTPQNRTVTIPNNNVTDDAIVNYSTKGIVRVDMTFGIGYEDDIRKAKDVLKRILEENEKVLDDPAPVVMVAELADSSVNFAVRPFVNWEDYLSVQLQLTEAVKLRFDEEGISIPFPQRDVHLFNAT